MTDGRSAVSYAVRLPVVARFVGQLCVVLAVLTVVPCLVSFALGAPAFAVRTAIVVLALAAVGGALSRFRVRGRLQANEPLVITGIVFLLAPLVMTFPLATSGLGYVDALFQAVSAVTTTGLSTLATVQHRSAAFLFTRAWMQWYGGLGIVVLSLALVLRPGIAARQLSTQPRDDANLVGGARARARVILLVYGALTAIGAVVLLLAGAGWFDAIVHALTAVSTGGFSTHDASLAGLSGWAPRVAVLVGCLAGAISLTLYHATARQGWRNLRGDPQVRALLVCALLVSATLAVTFHCFGGLPWGAAARDGSMTAVSAQTTAGFSSINVGAVDPASKLVLIASMFVGGSLGSTAGGVKLLRLLILARLVLATLRWTTHPRHAVDKPRLGGHTLEDTEMRDALVLVVLYGAVIVLSWLPFLASGYDPLNALFDVTSAVGTVGLSSGVTASGLPVGLKLVLCGDMLMGRLEIIAVLVLLYPRTWFGKRVELL